MAHASDDSWPLKPEELVFILAIAGRIDAQSRLLAKELDKSQYIYYTYAVVDSLSSSYTMFKYFLDVFIANSNSDVMHEILCSPVGMMTVALETLFLVSYSFLAFKYDGEKEDNFKKFIASSWPYVRDVMKGLKNAYKGWRAAIVAIGLIEGIDAKQLIIPVGLFLGVLSAINRFWIRGMLEKRKQMMVSNTALLTEIKKLSSLTQEELNDYLNRIQYQTLDTRKGALFSAAAGGVIDGLYLYVGILSLAALSPPTLTIMAAISAFYTLATVITRLYEEYDFQLRLLITQAKCKLSLTSKILETSYNNLLFLKTKTLKTSEDIIEIARLEKEVKALITTFEEQRNTLLQQITRGYYSSLLLGLKNGLYAYGALASLLFFVGSAIALAGIAFPPTLLIACISVGLIIIVGFIAEAMISDYRHRKNEENNQEDQPYQKILLMKSELENGSNAELLSKATFKKAINNGLDLKPSPQYFYQEGLEIFRSLFSGFGKGQKFVSFAGNAFQEMDNDGHYHDTFVMNCFAVASGLLFGAILAFRALARGFGRPQWGQTSLIPDDEAPPTPPILDDSSSREQEEIKPTPSPIPNTPKVSFANPTLPSFFKPNEDADSQKLMTRSQSEPVISQIESRVRVDTIRGLT